MRLSEEALKESRWEVMPAGLHGAQNEVGRFRRYSREKKNPNSGLLNCTPSSYSSNFILNLVNFITYTLFFFFATPGFGLRASY